MPYIQFPFGPDPLRGIRIAVLTGVGVIAFGTAGYMLVEGMSFLNALYMTVITLSTVGYKEVHELGDTGKIFTMILILTGVGLLGFVLSVIVQMVLEGHFQEHVARRRMDAIIKRMKGHAIIAGFGRVGRQVAAEFDRRGAAFVILERAEDNIPALLQSKYLHVLGNATEDDALREAGIEQAATLISTLPDTAQNVYLTLTARHLNPKLMIVARADSSDGETKLRRAGADQVVVPHELGGTRMALGVLRPNVVDFVHMAQTGDGELVIEEIQLRTGSPFTGKSLADSNLRQTFGVMVLGLKKPAEQLIFNPPNSAVLEAEDTLVVIGRQNDLERLNAATQ